MAAKTSFYKWTYYDKETCLLLEDEVTIITQLGLSLKFAAGDLLIFSAGINCRWDVYKAVRKHYRFGD